MLTLCITGYIFACSIVGEVKVPPYPTRKRNPFSAPTRPIPQSFSTPKLSLVAGFSHAPACLGLSRRALHSAGSAIACRQRRYQIFGFEPYWNGRCSRCLHGWLVSDSFTAYLHSRYSTRDTGDVTAVVRQALGVGGDGEVNNRSAAPLLFRRSVVHPSLAIAVYRYQEPWQRLQA